MQLFCQPQTNPLAVKQSSEQHIILNLAVSQYETSIYVSWEGRWWSPLGFGYSKSMITAVTFHTFTFWIYFIFMQTFGTHLSVSSFYLSLCDQIYITIITEFYHCLNVTITEWSDLFEKVIKPYTAHIHQLIIYVYPNVWKPSILQLCHTC